MTEFSDSATKLSHVYTELFKIPRPTHVDDRMRAFTPLSFSSETTLSAAFQNAEQHLQQAYCEGSSNCNYEQLLQCVKIISEIKVKPIDTATKQKLMTTLLLPIILRPVFTSSHNAHRKTAARILSNLDYRWETCTVVSKKKEVFDTLQTLLPSIYDCPHGQELWCHFIFHFEKWPRSVPSQGEANPLNSESPEVLTAQITAYFKMCGKIPFPPPVTKAIFDLHKYWKHQQSFDDVNHKLWTAFYGETEIPDKPKRDKRIALALRVLTCHNGVPLYPCAIRHFFSGHDGVQSWKWPTIYRSEIRLKTIDLETLREWTRKLFDPEKHDSPFRVGDLLDNPSDELRNTEQLVYWLRTKKQKTRVSKEFFNYQFYEAICLLFSDSHPDLNKGLELLGKAGVKIPEAAILFAEFMTKLGNPDIPGKNRYTLLYLDRVEGPLQSEAQRVKTEYIRSCTETADAGAAEATPSMHS